MAINIYTISTVRQIGKLLLKRSPPSLEDGPINNYIRVYDIYTYKFMQKYNNIVV